MMKRRLLLPFLILCAVATLVGCRRGEELRVVRLDPDVAARMADSIRQTVSVEMAPGLAYELWAVDSLAPDPIALHIDDLGRAYITRTIRQKNSEFDIRGHPQWMIESMGFQTVDDRRAFLRREFAPERSDSNQWLADLNGDSLHDWRDLAVEQEEVYRIEDLSGDGVADVSRLILKDFNEEVTDIAGAFLVHGEDMFLGVAPDVWRLSDEDGDGIIDGKTSISSGYAVHIGFSGHNISGLTVGPDGRIYWSIGDIGFDVTAPDGRRWSYPNQGAILRSNPDGSDFEVFAAGLRNTHEFVFDELGNIISVDNDGDHAGETERIVYIVNGSDSGWRANWQYGKYTDPLNNAYKVWMDEEMFKPRFEGQAAYITPPIAAYHSGPAGMAYNPGTALGEEWRNTFFVAEFVGAPARSRIFGFRLRPEGASFELADDRQVTRGILAVGMDFGPDGALYVGDWLTGWGTKNIGRIWKIDVPGADSTRIRLDTKALLAEEMDEFDTGELSNLLRHPDMRVRQKAQFALADARASDALLAAARQTEHRLARLHGLWGIWQLARTSAEGNEAQQLVAFLVDPDPEVRAQSAKILGDIRYPRAGDQLIPLLRDPSPRVQFFAAEALGRLEHAAAVDPLIAMLEANDDADAFLRHAGALALARIGNPEPVVALAGSPSRALRIAAVVALRRMRHPGVARFLRDSDEFIVTEAARAINDDGGIAGAVPELAAILRSTPFNNEALLRRSINANLRVGGTESAARLAAFAASDLAPDSMRAEAVTVLGVWPNPSVLDRVDGRYIGPFPNDSTEATRALAPHIARLLMSESETVSIASAEAAGRLQLRMAADPLLDRIRNDRSAAVRIAALDGLSAMDSPLLSEGIGSAMRDQSPEVRMRALDMVPTLDMPGADKAELLASVVTSGSIAEQQAAIDALAELQNDRSREVLASLMTALEAGSLAPDIQLEAIEAIDASGSDTLRQRLEAYRSGLPEDDVVARYADALEGGDPDAGGQIFFRHAAAQCVRCHAVGGRGGEVGPDLMNVGDRLSRAELLRSLVEPSAEITEGYGNVGAASAMPPMGMILSRREIRDVVAFLARLQDGRSAFGGGGGEEGDG